MGRAEVLREAKKLIQDPDHWVKGINFYERLNGEVAYCVRGAIDQAVKNLNNGSLYDWSGTTSFLGNLIRKQTLYGGITFWNDSPVTTHESVMKMFDEAIALAEAADQS